MMKAKKRIMLGLCMAITLCGVFSFPLTAHADGWVNHIQSEIELDTAYTLSFAESDYNEHLYRKYAGTYYDVYYQAYTVTIPEKGNINFYFESGDEGYFKYNTNTFSSGGMRGSAMYMYPAENADNAIWSAEGSDIKYTYSSARGVYYGSVDKIFNKGRYYLVISCIKPNAGLSHYTDGLAVTLNYRPALSAPAFKSVKPTKNKIKVEWSKVSGADKYELFVSTSKKMTSSSTKKYTLTKSAAKKTVTGLTSKKNYYVRIRSVKTIAIGNEKKTYRSAWSETYMVKTK